MMRLKPVCDSLIEAGEFLSFCQYKVQIHYYSEEEQRKRTKVYRMHHDCFAGVKLNTFLKVQSVT